MYVFTKSTSITSLADLQTGTNLTSDYKVVVAGRPVLEQVINNLGLDETYSSLGQKNSVADLIDDMGGVDQDIDSAEVQYINGYIDEVNRVRGTSSPHITSAGNYLLDGTQAVAYSRIRYTAGGDYKRTERQRTILFKVF